MRRQIISLFRNVVPGKLKAIIADEYLRKLKEENKYEKFYYSQQGEEIILLRLFGYSYKGFYVDIGAHHPKKFSNTYSLYRWGWKGLNVEANQGAKALFDELRPRDINLECVVSDREGETTFYQYEDTALNSVSQELVEQRKREQSIEGVNEITVQTKTVNSILEEHLPAEVKQIDVLNIDVEGMDHAVLRSLDWEKYAPTAIIAEDHNFDLEELESSSIWQLLSEKGYILFAKLYNSTIYIKAGFARPTDELIMQDDVKPKEPVIPSLTINTQDSRNNRQSDDSEENDKNGILKRMNGFFLNSVIGRKRVQGYILDERQKWLIKLASTGYLVEEGWWDSFQGSKPTDSNAKPLPWITYAAIHFLETRITKSHTIFEFGAGMSTLYYGKHAGQITSIEHNQFWYDELKQKIPANVDLHFQELVRGGDYCKFAENSGKRYDIIIVDGRDRVNCVLHSLSALNDHGVIIVDDTQREKYIPAADFLKENGFKELALWGVAPGYFRNKCTTVFYREDNCLGL